MFLMKLGQTAPGAMPNIASSLHVDPSRAGIELKVRNVVWQKDLSAFIFPGFFTKPWYQIFYLFTKMFVYFFIYVKMQWSRLPKRSEH